MTWSICRQTLVPHFFSHLSYNSLLLPLTILLLLLSCQHLWILNLSFLPRFTDYRCSYYFTTFCYPSIYSMTNAAVFSRLPFPSIFFFLSRALPYIYLPPNVMMLYIRASAPPTCYSTSGKIYFDNWARLSIT
jgi:hypothetical protein